MALPEAKNGAYNNFFKSQPLSVIPKPALGSVVTVDSTDSVRIASRKLGTLCSHTVLAASRHCKSCVMANFVLTGCGV
jgi:hypothetical protein